MKKYGYIILCCIASVLLAACGQETKKMDYDENTQYFSVNSFLDDQWQLLEGQPITLYKVAEINGDIDSSFQDMDEDFFDHIRSILEKTDISDDKFLGDYKVDFIEEPYYMSIVYDALDEDLLTRRVILNLDYTDNRVLHVYVETVKDNLFHTKKQRITYAPNKYIQIIEFEKSFLSSAKEIKLYYAFP